MASAAAAGKKICSRFCRGNAIIKKCQATKCQATKCQATQCGFVKCDFVKEKPWWTKFEKTMTVGGAATLLSAGIDWVTRRKEKGKEKERLDNLEAMQIATWKLVKKNGEENAAAISNLHRKIEEEQALRRKVEEEQARRRSWW